MVTDKMVEAAAKAMFEHGDHGAWGDRDTEFWKGYAFAALEAALSASDAKPVLTQHRVRTKKEGNRWSSWSIWRDGEAKTNFPEIIEIEMRHLYAALVSPSDTSPVFTISMPMAELAAKLLSRAVFEDNGDRVSANMVRAAFEMELKHAAAPKEASHDD